MSLIGFRLLGICSLMAAPPARARADYDYLIKLLLIGDSGEDVSLSFLLLFVFDLCVLAR